MEMNREQLLKEIMAVDFTITDLHLYLNTHPCECQAVNLYNSYVQKSRSLRETFEKSFGPLNSLTSFSACPFQWINPPWPWQRQ